MQGTLFSARYLLGELLGTGGEATVYRALDQNTGKEVALRVPHAGKEQRQSPILPQISDYPNSWVRCLEWSRDIHHGSYQVLELLTGPTLREVINPEPLTWLDWQEFIVASLEALSELHAYHGVHADLHADNFLLHTTSEECVWKLLELPFLSFYPEQRKRPLFGRIETLSPERLAGQAPTLASDLYAMGCLYYLALSGEYPHPGATKTEIAIHHLRFSVRPLQEFSPSAPDLLCEGVMRLLERDPAHRFSTTAKALAHFQDGRTP